MFLIVLHTTGIVLPIEVILFRFKARVSLGAKVARFYEIAGGLVAPEKLIADVVVFGRKGTLAERCF